MTITERTRQDDDPRNTPVMLRRELLTQGYDDYMLTRLVRTGVWVRVRRGAYVDRAAHDRLGTADRYALRSRAALKQASAEVVLSHASGLPEYDAPTWRIDLSDVHLTRLDGRVGRHEAGVHQHCGLVLPGDVVTRNGVAVMSATRLGLEITTMADVEASLCVVNHLLNRGHTTLAAMAARYRHMLHWPHTLTTDLVLRLADGRIESVGESRSWYLFSRNAIPAPIPQFEVVGENGVVIARLDFAWPELGAYVEFDGRVKYEKLLHPGQSPVDVVLAEKRREELIRRRTGWRCLRLTWADLQRPEVTARLILEHLFPTR